jgi:Family of unknown function (DUF6356)
MDPLRPFTEHPASVGESYLEHLGVAVAFGSRMIFAGCACVMHGLLPFLFVRTGSDAVKGLNDRLLARHHRAAGPMPDDNRLRL